MSDALEDRQEFLILDQGGQIVYYQNASGEINEQNNQLISAASFLTAILQFAKAATKGSIISSFELGKSRIFLKVGDSIPLYYVFIVGKKISIKPKKVNARLKSVSEAFENCFSKYDIQEWDGSTDYFSSFRDTAKSILHF